MPTEEELQEMGEVVNAKSLIFEQLCQDRHDLGAEKYGPLTWMGNDVVRMMVEELADTVNYCRYQAIKLMLIQDMLEEQLGDEFKVESDDIALGWSQFQGTKDGWKK